MLNGVIGQRVSMYLFSLAGFGIRIRIPSFVVDDNELINSMSLITSEKKIDSDLPRKKN